MLSLSQTSGYAILALSCLYETAGQFVLAKDIAACTGVPLPYLSKVLHAMRRTGLIEAKRGYRGGFRLARPAAEISLLDVAEGVDGQWLPRCLLGLANCSPERRCPTHEFWTTQRARIENELRRVRLADVAAFASRGGLPGVAGCGSGQRMAPASIEGPERASEKQSGGTSPRRTSKRKARNTSN